VQQPKIEIVHHADECLVVLGGEIDYAAQRTIYAEIVQALEDCPDNTPAIAIDLGEVTFMDSSGLGALVQIRRQAIGRGQTVTLKKPPRQVLQLLEISRLNTLFPIERD
jgi:anti-anti-sigma factor